MSKVCVAVQPAAVSAKTDTETVADNTGEGVNTFEVLTCWDIPPTEKVQVAIAEVELAVKVIDSPSQNVEDDAEDAKAVEVKLTSGFTPTLIVIPGEKDEQPPPAAVLVVKDSTVTT